MIDGIIFAIKPIGKHIPHHLVLQKLKNKNPACKIDRKFRRTDVDALTWEFDNDVCKDQF